MKPVDPAETWGEYRITLPNTGEDSTQISIREVASQNQGSGPLIDDISITRLGAEADNSPAIDYSISSYEDTPVPLDIVEALTDTDGSESISLSVSGLPAGSILTDGSNNFTADGSAVDVTNWQLNDLRLIPEENSNTDFDLTFTAISTESANGDQAITSRVLHVDMIPVNDRPDTAAATTTIDEDTPYIFDLNDFAFSDVDVGNSLQKIQITALPAAGSLIYNGSPAAIDLEVSRADLLTGRLRFEPGTNENGDNYADFGFAVSDGELYSEPETFGFDVTPINDAPDVIAAVIESVTEDTAAISIDLLEHASDVDTGDVLSVANLTLNSGNAVGVSSSENSVSIDPDVYDYLPDGQTEIIVYNYDVIDGNGGSTAQTAIITVTGTNDSAVITGVDAATVVEEAAPVLTANGTLLISDADTGEALFSAESVTGSYGDLSITANGQWTYNADNSQSDVQSLGQDSQLTDSITVQAVDGTVHNITITLSGVNDVAQITGSSSATITEDVAVTAGDELLATGLLVVTDVDSNEAEFNPGSFNGLYGTILIDANGNWTYTSVNTQADIQALGDGDSITDTITVTTLDGTGQDITITINGSNDAAEITGINAGSVIEDAAALLATSGQLNITDIDAGEEVFTPESQTGSYGEISIDADGQWSYSADSSQTAIQELDDGESLTDSFTIQSVDGTEEIIDITINGENDAAVVDNSVSDQTIAEEQFFSFQIPANTFSDIEGDALTYTASLSDGSALPDWLSFDANTRTFSGTPDDPSVGTISVRVNANDGSLVTPEDFNLEVTAVNDAPELSDHPLVDNISHAYNFIAGAGMTTYDATGSGQNGSLSGSATWVTDRNGAGNALHLDGTEGVADLGNISTGGAMTLSVWVRYESFDQNWSRIFDFGNGQADNNIVLGHKQTTNTLAFHIYDGVGSPQDAELEVENFFVQGEWAHVTATIDTDGTLSLYKNGELAAQGPGVVPQEMVRSGNFIGKSHWGGDGYLEGSIDDVVLINGALNADEVSALYQADTVESLLSDSFHVLENSDEGTVVGTANATDVDNTNLTYSLTDDAGGRFTINSTNGEITVSSGADLNHEDTDSYAITVAVSDGELADSKTYTVHVTNTPEAPTLDNPVTDTGTDDSGLMSIDLLTHATAVEASETLSVNSLSLIEGDDIGVTFTGNAMTVDASAYAYLPDGVSETIQYSYNVVGSAGESSPQTVTITLTGNNESAVITGVDAGSLTEDTGSTLSASGSLDISDEDTGEDFFSAATHNGSYGSLNIDTSGNWSYTADNNQSAIQQLGEGDSLTDTITVSAVDGTTHDITLTISGTNDAAVISGSNTAIATEDSANGDNNLIVSGALAISDTDLGEEFFTETDLTGSFGTLTLNEDGQWTYIASNSQNAIQQLANGDSIQDGFDITSADGTLHQIIVTINGTNDGASIVGDSAGLLLEDQSALLTSSGTLSVTDVDSGEASFIAETISGTYGSLSINTQGDWSYSANSSQSAIQMLGDGESLTDTITIRSFDGSAHNIVITINGTNDAAIIGGLDTATITEDAAVTLTASGTLTISDTDSGEASFAAETISGTHGSLTIDADGNWNYSADNSQASIQALGDGESLTETIQTQSTDGTAHDVVITINGTNDDALITGVASGSVTEDDYDNVSPIGEQELIASGDLDIQDSDTGQASFVAEELSGSYGQLTIDSSGQWQYIADSRSSTIQALGVSESVNDIFTVEALDGTEHTVNITINGANDQAEANPVFLGHVAEDSDFIIHESDILAGVTDIDGDNLTVTNISLGVGSHTLTNNNDGTWTYSPEEHATGLVEMLYTVSDGTVGFDVNHVISINFTAVADTAVISGEDTATITEDTSASLTAIGTINVTDPDADEAGFTVETISGSYGSLTIDADGNWNYSADNSQASIQTLGDGDSLTETIEVQSIDGTTHNIVIAINGTNDVAVIGGTDTATVTEDDAATLTISGALTISDTDSGEASFTAETVSGTYGSLSIDASGNWNYSADNSQASIQALGDGDNLTETIDIQSVDGTTHNVVITINGTNDAAVIGGADTGVLSEDDGPTLSTSGTVSITDSDTGENSFVAETHSGSYGSLSIDASGNWSYSADNSQAAIQTLADGESITETLTVQSIDGTTHDIVITINGANDAAIIGGVDTASVQEDNATILAASGALTVSDADSGEISFTAETVSGTYGSLNIDALGNWSYSADNSQASIQALGNGDSLTDTIQIQSLDGTTHDVIITINGTNDAAVIGGVDTASIQEDNAATLTASGALTVSDTDTGEASFTAETISGSYGSLVIDTSGNWNYSTDNSQTAIQALGDGDSLTETIQIQSVDGTAQNIVITINGTNDTAVIGGVDSAVIQEDSAATLTASGALTVSDTDSGEASFTADTVSGNYGSLTIDAAGNWNYSADNSQSIIQALSHGDSLTETIQVQSLDSTTHDVVVTINGTNDTAVIGGVDTASVTEDSAATLSTSGTLTIADTDSGEASFSADTVSGSYGSLTIDASGNWSYSADNSQSAINTLADGESLTETLSVQSADGTAHSVVITINGTNDGPVATADSATDVGSIATLTSNNDQGITLTASSTLSGGYYDPYKAFDGVEADALNNQSSWAVSGSSGWLQVELPTDQRIGAYSIKAINHSDRQPKDWEVLASNDGINYTVIDSQTGVNNWSPRETKEFMIDDAGSYTHFKINITDNNGNSYTGFDGFQLFEWSSTTAHTSEHETLSFDVLTNDYDVDNGDSLSLDSVEIIDGDGNSLSGKGVASIVDGKLQFDPNGDFAALKAGDSEAITVSYTISDSHGAQSTSTTEVTVFGTNFAQRPVMLILVIPMKMPPLLLPKPCCWPMLPMRMEIP